MKNRTYLVLGLLLITGGWAQAKDKETASETRLNGVKIELARYAKAFVGQGNVTVEVAPYKTEKGEGAILLFKGIESPWDGKAMDHEVRPASRNGKDYATRFEGKEWVALVQRDGAYDNKTSYRLYVPGVKEEIVLTPSDGAAQLTNPRKIFMEYQEQQTSEK